MVADRAGNTLKRSRWIHPKSATSLYQDWIGKSDRQDFYRFRLSNRSNATFSLISRRAGIKIGLLDSQGRTIQQSASFGNQRQFNTLLEAGAYYLKVTFDKRGNQKAGATYRLRTAVTSSDNAYLSAEGNASGKTDLRGLSFSAPSTLAAGNPFAVNFSVRNQGSTPASGVRVGFYLSGDSKITTGDRFLGSYEVGTLAARSNSALLQTTLTLPDAASNFLWNGDGIYHIGMVVDSLNLVTESDETNNANLGAAVDYSMIRVNQTSPPRSFNIQFDYRFDTLGWFTPERRAALEAAAQVWENIIQDDFPDVPAGTNLLIRNPQPVSSTITTSSVANQYANASVRLDRSIDDLLIFVGAGNLGSLTVGQGGVSLSATGNLGWRWQGANFQPWTGSITFNTGANWFFDPTPSTADDLLPEQNDFITVAVHEIGHILGFSPGPKVLERQLVNQTFTGANVVAHNGGSPLPMEADGSHIKYGYEPINNGMPIMSPVTKLGERFLPTMLDLAFLDDLGYTVNYNAASQNPSSLTLRSQASVATRCGCASCLMLDASTNASTNTSTDTSADTNANTSTNTSTNTSADKVLTTAYSLLSGSSSIEALLAS